MPKFIINVIGEYEVVEAKDLAEAGEMAYEMWLDASDQDYGAEPYTAELAKEYGIEEEEDA